MKIYLCKTYEVCRLPYFIVDLVVFTLLWFNCKAGASQQPASSDKDSLANHRPILETTPVTV